MINQYKFKHHILFSASFYRTNEDEQRSDEIEIFINWNTNIKLTETDFDEIDTKSQLVYKIQIQETKESGWIFDKINSMKKKLVQKLVN